MGTGATSIILSNLPGSPEVATNQAVDERHHQIMMVGVGSGQPGEAIDFMTCDARNGIASYMGDSASLDAFNRIRVCSPQTIFDSKLLAGDKQPLLWDEALESGAGISSTTPTANKPYIDIVSTLNTAGVFTRQTLRRFNYQPGKSQLIVMSGVIELSGGGTGVKCRLGCFDDANGLFFEMSEGVMSIVTRTSDSGSPVDTPITVSEPWNIDPLDGTGLSDVTIDWAKIQIFVIDFRWIGRVRFGLKIAGRIIYFHEIFTGNVSTIPWASTPNLPIRYQLITTGSSPASAMRFISAEVVSEGGLDEVGFSHSHATADKVNANVVGTVYALLGCRLKADQLGCDFEPTSVSILSLMNDSFEWLLIYNPTVAGTFTFTDKPDSCIQIATGDAANPSTNTVTGGVVIDRGFGVSDKDTSLPLESLISLGAKINGTRDIIVLAVRPLSSNADIQGALNWTERT